MSYNYLYFRVLNKKSASPSIIVHSFNTDSVFKIWLADDKSKYTDALIYEANVYDTVIKNLLNEDNTLPFVGGQKIDECDGKEMANQIGLDMDDELGAISTWCKIIGIFTKLKSRRFNYENLDDINEKADIMYNEEYDYSNFLQTRLMAIKLPYYTFSTFKDILKYNIDPRSYIRKIVRGISAMYSHGLIHNDLHYENIMVLNNDDVLIFDWDSNS